MAPRTLNRRFSGVRLRELREAQGLTREELAVGIARSYATIVAYETGRAVPPGGMVGLLADILSVSPDRFYVTAEPVPA